MSRPEWFRAPRTGVLVAVAVAIYVAILALRMAERTPGFGFTALFAVPVALLAAAEGIPAGAAGAGVAMGLFAVADRVFPIHSGHRIMHTNPVGYLSEALTLFALAVAVGWYSRRRRAVEAQFASLLEATPDALLIADTAGQIVYVNAQAAVLFDYSTEELVGSPIDALLPGAAGGSHQAHRGGFLGELATADWESRLELRALRKDGRELPVEVSLSPLKIQGGMLVSAAVRDVSERMRIEAVNRRLAAIVEQSEDAIVVKSPNGIIHEWNRSAERLFGYPRREAIGMPAHMLVPPDRHGEEDDIIRRAFRGEATEQLETSRIRKDGSLLHVSVTVSPIRDSHGEVVAAATISRDISDRKLFEGQLQYLADHDSLTGLFNRRRFDEELRRELARVRRFETPGAVLAIDLDNFKYINDTLGHSFGDEVIAQAAASLKRRLRETDVLARLGGDEFAVILTATDQAGAYQVATGLLEAIRSDLHVNIPGESSRVTASIGVAAFADATELRSDDLLVEADIAMYDAKEAGRDRVVVYESPEDRPVRMQARLAWADHIRRALREDRFVLHAQSILPLNGEQMPRHELLLRMVAEDGSLISPAVFLSVAERMELIGEIDRWVLKRAIDLLAAEQRAGHDVRLELNVSAKSVGDPEYADLIEKELAAAGVDGRGLCFEITETAAIVNFDHAKRFAERLADLGCEFALDDFGTGFASFYYLKHLPFDYLKIDGEFITGIAGNTTDQLVVRALVDIARGLGKRTIAEFVGDQQTLDLLRSYGVDYAQGFYIAEPVPLRATDLSRLSLEPAGSRRSGG